MVLCPGSCSRSQRLPCQCHLRKQRLHLWWRGEFACTAVTRAVVHFVVILPFQFQLREILRFTANRCFQTMVYPKFLVRVWGKPFPVSTSLSCCDVTCLKSDLFKKRGFLGVWFDWAAQIPDLSPTRCLFKMNSVSPVLLSLKTVNPCKPGTTFMTLDVLGKRHSCDI